MIRLVFSNSRFVDRGRVVLKFTLFACQVFPRQVTCSGLGSAQLKEMAISSCQCIGGIKKFWHLLFLKV